MGLGKLFQEACHGLGCASLFIASFAEEDK